MHNHVTLVMDDRWVDSHQVVVDLRGDLRMATVAAVRKRALQLIKRNPKALVLNLSAVESVDTSGIAMLVELLRVLRNRGGTLILVGLNEQLQKMVEMTHLDQLLELRGSVEEALPRD